MLLEVPSSAVIAAGLSMPHSPRWHDGRLWLLESGTGTFGIVDPVRGRYEPLLELPGFTRGLSFCGPYAFIGLSQVRESAVFSGIPLVERPEKRTCGVWVVDLRTGQPVAWVEFDSVVQEIFAVEVLPGLCFPDVINDDYGRIADSFVLPDAALAEVPETLRTIAVPSFSRDPTGSAGPEKGRSIPPPAIPVGSRLNDVGCAAASLSIVNEPTN